MISSFVVDPNKRVPTYQKKKLQNISSKGFRIILNEKNKYK